MNSSASLELVANRGRVRMEVLDMAWKVNWDNGKNACGTFPQVFDTEEEAQSFANAWAADRNVEDGLDPKSEEAYFAEPIEVDDAPDAESEGWDEVGDLWNAGLNHRGLP